jgi:hypothetical protein
LRKVSSFRTAATWILSSAWCSRESLLFSSDVILVSSAVTSCRSRSRRSRRRRRSIRSRSRRSHLVPVADQQLGDEARHRLQGRRARSAQELLGVEQLALGVGDEGEEVGELGLGGEVGGGEAEQAGGGVGALRHHRHLARLLDGAVHGPAGMRSRAEARVLV